MSTDQERAERATLYEALARELADWKRAHPNNKEDPAQVPIPSLPVVWQIHNKLTKALADLRQASNPQDPPKGPNDLANLEDIGGLVGAVNEVLSTNSKKLGGDHRLEAEQVRRLVLLMLESANEPLSPYLAPAIIKGW
jgi:hypothetical protein